MHAKNDDLNSSLASLKSEIKLIKFNVSLPCKSYDALLVQIEVLEGDMFEFASECGNLNDDLAKARNEIVAGKLDALCHVFLVSLCLLD
jgi:hypothetical protein